MKNLKYILAIVSVFIVFHVMELLLFPSDYKQEINQIKEEVNLIEKIASGSDSKVFVGM